MSKANGEKVQEIVPLNDDWLGFDLENVDVEELEQRLEMSLITLPLGVAELGDCNGHDCTQCDLGCCVH